MIRLSAGKSKTNRILSAVGLIVIVLLRTAPPPRAKGGWWRFRHLIAHGQPNSPSAHTNTAPERSGAGWYEVVPSRIRESQRFKVTARFPKGRRLWKPF